MNKNSYNKGAKMGLHDIIANSFYYGKRSQQRNTISDRHYHNLFEIYFLEEGVCHYFIDNSTYSIKAGDLVLIPEGAIHKTVYRDSDAKRRLIHCAQMYVPASVSQYLSTVNYVYRNNEITSDIKNIFDEIEKEYYSSDRFSESLILYNVHRLFFLLARNPNTEAPSHSMSSYIAETIAYIKENYFEDITLPALASKCAISPEHLSRIFKRDTGFGVSEYLSIIRLQQAQLLLRQDPSLSVAKVAEMCGFSDSNYFSKRFKATYGISPLSFRKQ